MTQTAIIKALRARKVFNSRGEETIEVEVQTLTSTATATAPAGKSRGRHEVEYYPAGGVDAALNSLLERVQPRLLGVSAADQPLVDSVLAEADGIGNFGAIGGNAAYAVSVACAAAAAQALGRELFQHLSLGGEPRVPYPLGNVLGGGKHAGRGAPDIQEFLSLPLGASSILQALKANFLVHGRLGKLLEDKDPTFAGGRGDEGGWCPRIGNVEALEAVERAAEEVSAQVGFRIAVGLDLASSSLWDPRRGKYVYASEGRERDPGEQLEFVLRLIGTFHLAYVEDPLHEEDFDGFSELTAKARGCLVCGDDLFVSNRERLAAGARVRAGNAIIIKPNQVGTLTAAIETARLAHEAGYLPVASHRSGENADAYLAHLAVALGCPLIKAGVVGGERVAKLNELIRIWETLGPSASMAALRL